MYRKAFLCLALVLGSHGFARAADEYAFEGSCQGSTLKVGPDTARFATLAGTPVSCDSATIAMTRGSTLIRFGSKIGGAATAPDFAGSIVGSDDGALMFPIERLAVSGAPVRLDRGRGYCFLDNATAMERAKKLTCAGMTDTDGHKTIFDIEFTISSGEARP